MQIGADIYCDTGLILREIDRRFPDPPLAPREIAGIVWALRNWAERAWFSVTVAVVFGKLADTVPEAFIKDREELSGRPFDVQALKFAAPMMADQWRANADLLEAQISSAGPWLYGALPSAADLAAYLNVWFLRSGAPDTYAQLTTDLTALSSWVARMGEIGHGQPVDISAEEAFHIAAASSPEKPRPSIKGEPQDIEPGDQVIVMADDYGRNPISGEVALLTPQEIAIRRLAEDAGEVVVHFPRAGYLVRRV